MSYEDPTRRFSNRARDYALYRPGYPSEVIECLRRECGLTPASVIADIGSGTGILTGMLLANGNQVWAVEPNEAMRSEAERALAHFPGFTSVDGRAEATTLPAQSVDLVTAGQAFHWFDAAASRLEFGRILRPGGYIALVWNARAYQADPLMEAYERVLAEFGMGYHVVTHRGHDRDLEILFPSGHEFRSFNHARLIDYNTFWGGFLSASYAPASGDERYEPMREALKSLFDAYEREGRVTFLYQTHLYFGLLSPGATLPPSQTI